MLDAGHAPGLEISSALLVCSMATTTKKTPKKSQPKPRATSAAASIAKLKKTIAAQAREIRQGAEQQTATSEILRVIAQCADGYPTGAGYHGRKCSEAL